MTVGPWKPISLETYQLRISDVDIRSTVSPSLDAKVDVTVSLSAAGPAVASVQIKGPDGALLLGQDLIKITEPPVKAQFALSAGTFELWYPVGYGKQPIYTVEITIADEVSVNSFRPAIKIRKNSYHLFISKETFWTRSLRSSRFGVRSSFKMN